MGAIWGRTHAVENSNDDSYKPTEKKPSDCMEDRISPPGRFGTRRGVIIDLPVPTTSRFQVGRRLHIDHLKSLQIEGTTKKTEQVYEPSVYAPGWLSDKVSEVEWQLYVWEEKNDNTSTSLSRESTSRSDWNHQNPTTVEKRDEVSPYSQKLRWSDNYARLIYSKTIITKLINQEFNILKKNYIPNVSMVDFHWEKKKLGTLEVTVII